MASENHRFFATTAKGMEECLATELRDLRMDEVEIGRGGVHFTGSLEAGYRACLWSRIANRVLLPLVVVDAPNPEALYEGVQKIHWDDHLTPESTFRVEFVSTQSKITHTHYGALKVKDAIVDQFRKRTGTRPSIRLTEPDVQIYVYLSRDQATVSLDLSGESLHKRGYRQEGGQAPLKENLAAAMLMIAGWPKTKDVAYLDPMCGSGTTLIEAAWMASRRAPGLGRPYFGFLGWQGHVPKIWQRLLQEAQEAVIRDPKQVPKVVGYDADFRAVRLAIENVEKAGLHGMVHVEKRELAGCNRIAEQGIILVNPPYGERLGEVEDLRDLYKSLGDLFKKEFKGWEGYIFTGSSELAKSVGLKASRRNVLWNGPIECRLLKYELY